MDAGGRGRFPSVPPVPVGERTAPPASRGRGCVWIVWKKIEGGACAPLYVPGYFLLMKLVTMASAARRVFSNSSGAYLAPGRKEGRGKGGHAGSGGKAPGLIVNFGGSRIS